MKIIGICIVLCFLQNCGTDQIDRVNRKYVLYNDTEHEVKIDIYQRGMFQSTSHIIGIGIIDEGTSTNDAGSSNSAPGALGVDSMVVSYNDNKRQIYYYSESSFSLEAIPNTKHSPLDDDAYEIINNELYRFTFTEEDYENAEEIEE